MPPERLAALIAECREPETNPALDRAGLAVVSRRWLEHVALVLEGIQKAQQQDS